LQGGLAALNEAERGYLSDRYRLPRPRLALGQRLAGVATAMMDISDGLVADLGHICAASRVGAVVEAAMLPLSGAAAAAIKATPALMSAALAGGDDYELLFMAPAASASVLARLAEETKVAITRIGHIEHGPAEVRVLDATGALMEIPSGGYRHF